MTRGEATILLELDRTRGSLSIWTGNRASYQAERTGWKRFLTLTKMLHVAKADYRVQFEFVPREDFLPICNTLHLCDGARLKARIDWRTA